MRPVQEALVTGATGFVGSALVRQLLARGTRVRALVRSRSRRESLPGKVEIFEGEIGDSDVLRRAVDGVGVVFHLLSKLHIENPGPSDRKEYFRVNVEGTKRLMDVLSKAQVQRLVYFSSINVYGSTRPGEIRDEDSRLDPDSSYAESKVEAEKVVRQASSFVILRLAAVYGPGMKGNYLRLARALKSRWFPKLGEGANRRTLVYRTDACEAAIRAAEEPRANGLILNVTDGSLHTFHDILCAICDAIGRPPPKREVPMSLLRLMADVSDEARELLGVRLSFGRASLEKVFGDLAVSGERVQKCLAFRPQYDLKTGWKETLASLSKDARSDK